MNAQVPLASLLCMGFCLLFAFALPIGLCVWLHKFRQAELSPFFVGCGVMLLFAFGLESALNMALLSSPLGSFIRGRNWLYALYGGFMAGLFEETGRFLAFKTVLKKKRDKDVNALMYGAGHGGIEAIVLLGLTSVNNIIYAVLLNTGCSEMLLQGLPEEAAQQMRGIFAQLADSAPVLFLGGALERLFSVAIQIALSVLVWFAAKQPGKVWLYPLAILLHLAVDATAALLSLGGSSVWLIELFVALFALSCCLLARTVWKRCVPPADPAAN